jgi:hypothetical protein
MAQQLQMGAHWQMPPSFEELFRTTTPEQATVQKESAKRMWTEYMQEAEKYDNRTADSWKEDSNGILVFVRPQSTRPSVHRDDKQKTSIFSATVAAFIIEFYKKLSPDSGDQIVDLLCQITQQLPNFRNGTCSAPQNDQSFSPSVSMIWVITMWMISLLLSLMSALFATLLQQWARGYVQNPQSLVLPNERARARSFLFFGTLRFNVRNVVEMAPALLHYSVFLFFVGLVILFYTIQKAVALIVTLFVGLFAVSYIALTVLPFIYRDCPFITPLSTVWWYSHQATLLSFHHLVASVRRQLYDLPDHVRIFDVVQSYVRLLKDGFRKVVVNEALEASDNVDFDAITWWLGLPELVEESRAQEFFACVPEEIAVRLIRDPNGPGGTIFRRHLDTLLRSCGPDSVAGLNRDEHKARLLVCLHTIYRIAQAAVVPGSDVDVEIVRRNFAVITRMHAMWTDSDSGIRVVSRSMCALVARCLLHRELLEVPDLVWLQDVTGVPFHTIFNSDIATRDRMNLKAFVYGVLSGQQSDLVAEHATSFTETLAILMNIGTQRPYDRGAFQEQLPTLVELMTQDGFPHTGEVLNKLHRMFQDFLP